jgi:quinol-cytochrome oxidoreductase complex cytochrome b subunit
MAENTTILKRITRSISQSPVRPGTEKKRPWAAYENLVLHIHPRKVPVEALRFTLTWGLGGMCVVLYLLLVMSGVLLLFVYEPFPERAYQSVLTLQNQVMFGQLIRNIHYWSANFLIVGSFLHLLRVFFTGAFHSVRQFNWVMGIFLFTGIIFSNFTGYLLPWDQLAYWAVTISTGMTEYIPMIGGWVQAMLQGGDETGSATLLIFFTLHATVLPGTLLILMLYHFWRVRKAGGIVMPYTPEDAPHATPPMADSIPNLVLREGVVALVLVAVIMTVSVLFDAPLGDMANPGLSPNPAKAPWYFMGFQELLLHFHPAFAVFFIPTTLFLMFIMLPYLRYDSAHSGTWFFSKAGKKAGIAATSTAMILVPSAIILNEYIIDLPGWFPTLPPEVSDGLFPTAFVVCAIAIFNWAIKKRIASVNNETVQALFTLAVVSFILLTMAGIWFRGEGMGLVWPFGH